MSDLSCLALRSAELRAHQRVVSVGSQLTAQLSLNRWGAMSERIAFKSVISQSAASRTDSC